MNTPESPRPAPSPPTSAPPPLRRRAPRRERREDLEDCFFDVVWPLPRTLSFPTLTRRVAALGLDLVIALPTVLLAIALASALSGATLYRYDACVRFAAVTVLLYAIYFAYWESSPERATPGKMLLDIRVVTAGDRPLTFAAAIIRYALRLATLLTLNAGLWLAWRSPRGQALHDRWCGTFVVAHHVMPGQLRRAARPSRLCDLAVAAATSVVAYALVFQLAPAILREVDLADRLESAIADVTPALRDGALVGSNGDWSPRLREASDAVGALHLALDVDAEGRRLVLRAPAAMMDDDSGRERLVPPSIRLERAATPTDGEGVSWSCRALALPFYARPSYCRDAPAPRPDLDFPVSSASTP